MQNPRTGANYCSFISPVSPNKIYSQIKLSNISYFCNSRSSILSWSLLPILSSALAEVSSCSFLALSTDLVMVVLHPCLLS